MATVTIRQAEADLSDLIARAERGEEILIARESAPVVRLVPVVVATRRREPGQLKGQYDLPDAFFFDPLPDEEQSRWEGDDAGRP